MAEKKVPMRSCVGCRELHLKKEMIRVLKTADTGDVIIDANGRTNGRGAYLCRNSECLEKAFKNKGLERSLKLKIPLEIVEELRREMSLIDG